MGSHMTPEEFRENGYAVVDWITDQLENIESYPVFSNVAPGEIAAMMPESAPQEPEPFDALMRDLDDAQCQALVNELA